MTVYNKTLALIACLGLLLVQHTSQAASTSGGIILKEGVGARAQGMGEAFVGLADDASTLYWNTGGLSQVQGINASATYVAGLAESAYQQMMFATSLENLGTIGLGINLLQGGKIDLDKPNGTISSVQSQSDLVVNAGYGMKLSNQLGIGAGLKMYNSTLVEEYNATAFGLDVGALFAVSNEFKVGVALQNLGTEIKYKEVGDPMPLTARLGAGYTVPIAALHDICLAVDMVKTNDQDTAVNMGAEYWYSKMLAARLGYKAGYALESLTAGLGVRYDQFQLDYAFGMVQELNSTHKITLSFIMDGGTKQAVMLPEKNIKDIKVQERKVELPKPVDTKQEKNKKR